MGASFSKLKSKFFPTEIRRENFPLQSHNDNLLNQKSNENEILVVANANNMPNIVVDDAEEVNQIESYILDRKIEHFSNGLDDYSDSEESDMDFFYPCSSVKNEQLANMFDSSNMKIEMRDHRSDVVAQVTHDEATDVDMVPQHSDVQKLEIEEECFDDEMIVIVCAENNNQNEGNVIIQNYLEPKANKEQFVTENADSKTSKNHDFHLTSSKMDFDKIPQQVELQQMEIDQCIDADMNVKQGMFEENNNLEQKVVNQNHLHDEVAVEQFVTEMLDLHNTKKFDSVQHQYATGVVTQEVDVQKPETIHDFLRINEVFSIQNIIDPNHLHQHDASQDVIKQILTESLQDIENGEQNQCLVNVSQEGKQYELDMVSQQVDALEWGINEYSAAEVDIKAEVLTENNPNEQTSVVQHNSHQEPTTRRVIEARKLKEKEKIKVAKSFKPPKDVVLANSRTSHKIVVDPELAVHLKEHQIEGIKFTYNCCFRDKSGCILAHCMGLGKTFQAIALVHTAINESQLETNQILVICPKSTIMNWKHEFEMWLKPVKGKRRIKLFLLPETSNLDTKLSILKNWSAHGKGNEHEASCFLINYEAFRILVDYPNSKKSIEKYSVTELAEIQNNIRKYLLDPADVVICDEGHTIKNDKTATCRAVNQIRTKRRIILTGTPMQNHLMEYYTMVNFIKPKFVSTKDKFEQRYAKPIKAGQHSDSSPEEVVEMKKCSYALHKKLSACVQRKEVSILKDFLPEKFEYVLLVPLTGPQITLYKHFLENTVVVDGKNLFTDYHLLRKIWTHPKVLDMAFHDAVTAKKKKMKRLTIKDEDDSEDEVLYDIGSSNLSPKLQRDWWRKRLTAKEFESILPSYKLILLFEILKECQKTNDKCLIFSSFVQVLNVVEFFLKQINEQTKSGKLMLGMENFNGPWERGWDYFRLDGSITKSARQNMIDSFNDQANQRVRLFLISAKAGGQGINLVGANRVILLDSSWNPSNDQQNFFRVFRLGQTKNCYIYRLLAMGTMDEKIYSRAVTKQAMSYRVVDKQQVDRHYSMADLMELYSLNIPKMEDRPIPSFPKDPVLAHLLNNFPKMIYKYHIHDSLLENTEETDLNEDEKAEAWRKFEHEDTFDRSLTVSSALEVASSDPKVQPIVIATKYPQSLAHIKRKIIENRLQSVSKRIRLEKEVLKTKDENAIHESNGVDFIPSQMNEKDYLNSVINIESKDGNVSQPTSQPAFETSEFLKLSPKLKRRNSEPIEEAIQSVLKKIRIDGDVLRTVKPSTLSALSPVKCASPQRHDNQSHELDKCYQFQTFWTYALKSEVN